MDARKTKGHINHWLPLVCALWFCLHAGWLMATSIVVIPASSSAAGGVTELFGTDGILLNGTASTTQTGAILVSLASSVTFDTLVSNPGQPVTLDSATGDVVLAVGDSLSGGLAFLTTVNVTTLNATGPTGTVSTTNLQAQTAFVTTANVTRLNAEGPTGTVSSTNIQAQTGFVTTLNTTTARANTLESETDNSTITIRGRGTGGVSIPSGDFFSFENATGGNLTLTILSANTVTALAVAADSYWSRTPANAIELNDTAGVAMASDTRTNTSTIVPTANTLTINVNGATGSLVLAAGDELSFTALPSGVDARGDIPVRPVSGVYQPLAVGGANTVIHGGTDPSYSAVVSGDIADGTIAIIDLATAVVNRINSATATDGGVVFGNGTNYSTSAAGTSGQLFKSLGTADPVWSDAPMTVSGGYVTRSGTNLLFSPDRSNRVFCFETVWVEKVIPDAGITVACTGLANDTDFFLYVFDSAGTLTLDLSTTGTTTQNGIKVKSGTTSRTFIARCRSNGSGAITTFSEDASTQLVNNAYNKRTIGLFKIEATNSWTDASAVYRAANGTSTNRINVVCDGVEGLLCIANVTAQSTGANNFTQGIGIDSTTVNSAKVFTVAQQSTLGQPQAVFVGVPTIGHHAFQWLEYSQGATVTYFGDAGLTYLQSGITLIGRF